MSLSERALWSRWRTLLQPFDADDDRVRETFDELVALHTAASSRVPGRRRLETMLSYVDELEHRAAHPDRVRLAAWFAASGYDARDSERSACAARAERMLARLGLPEVVIAEVRRLVLVSRETAPDLEDDDAQVFNDSDLALLGVGPTEYLTDLRTLQTEDGRSPVCWLEHRRQVVKAMLALDTVFLTPEMRAGHEASAQLNLAREAAQLASQR
jgi:predicted metal-dependent HD superfamily phosphohydrolase